jgi:PTH1 family peptidyl-tRNA hydrolase
VLGLGNPGAEYERTRHNIGFQVVESLARRAGIALTGRRWASHHGQGLCAGKPTALLLPQTFMNRSGEALDGLLEDYPEFDPSQGLIAVYDDLDLPCGQMRLRASGGAGGQKGMASLIQSAGSESIPRLRFGIGRPPEGQGVTEFVLAPFSPEEAALLPPCIEKATEALEHFIEFGIDSAMNHFN